MSSPITIAALNTFPVKGLSACPADQVPVGKGEMFPLDRAWAIEAGARKFDPANPTWLPKIAFAQLMSHEKLAELETTLDSWSVK